MRRFLPLLVVLAVASTATTAGAFTVSQANHVLTSRVKARYRYQTEERLVQSFCKKRSSSRFSCSYAVFKGFRDGEEEGESGNESSDPFAYSGYGRVVNIGGHWIAQLVGGIMSG